MGFPASPANNQQATVGGITYFYNSTKTAWLRNATVGVNLSANSVIVTANTISVASTSGALLVTGGAGVQGNINSGGSINAAASISAVGAITAATVSATTISSTTLNGTLQTAAQPNITSTGQLQTASLGVGTSPSGNVGEIRATNAITSYYSDERLKINLGPIENALDMIDKLHGFYHEASPLAESYGYSKEREIGVSAQEVNAVLPEIVAPAPIDPEYMTVRYERFAPLFIEAIKELRREVTEIKRRLEGQ